MEKEREYNPDNAAWNSPASLHTRLYELRETMQAWYGSPIGTSLPELIKKRMAEYDRKLKEDFSKAMDRDND